VPIEAVMGREAFKLERILEREPEFLSGEDHHSHNEDIMSLSFEVAEPLDENKFNAWIGELLQTQGQNLLRTKGVLNFKGQEDRFAFQAVHMIADGDYIGPWPEGSARKSKIVFIGRDLNRPRLRRGFEGCVAA
jgi:G3E family GTPase